MNKALVVFAVVALFAGASGQCFPDCPQCTKANEPPVPDGCGGTCPTNTCRFYERCSATAGYRCVVDYECAENCGRECLEPGQVQPDNGCNGRCELPRCGEYSDECEPACPECSKSWEAPFPDGCGHWCPVDTCNYTQRCSASSGQVCVKDLRCASNCRGCLMPGQEQPNNGCGGTCLLPPCPPQGCTPDCPECTKGWERPLPDSCGGFCPQDTCGPDERCSGSAGDVCVPQPECEARCLEQACVEFGRVQKTNWCGGTCAQPDCYCGDGVVNNVNQLGGLIRDLPGELVEALDALAPSPTDILTPGPTSIESGSMIKGDPDTGCLHHWLCHGKTTVKHPGGRDSRFGSRVAGNKDVTAASAPGEGEQGFVYILPAGAESLNMEELTKDGSMNMKVGGKIPGGKNGGLGMNDQFCVFGNPDAKQGDGNVKIMEMKDGYMVQKMVVDGPPDGKGRFGSSVDVCRGCKETMMVVGSPKEGRGGQVHILRLVGELIDFVRTVSELLQVGYVDAVIGNYVAFGGDAVYTTATAGDGSVTPLRVDPNGLVSSPVKAGFKPANDGPGLMTIGPNHLMMLPQDTDAIIVVLDVLSGFWADFMRISGCEFGTAPGPSPNVATRGIDSGPGVEMTIVPGPDRTHDPDGLLKSLGCLANLHLGAEECDDGNMDDFDECSNDCTWNYNPRCPPRRKMGGGDDGHSDIPE